MGVPRRFQKSSMMRSLYSDIPYPTGSSLSEFSGISGSRNELFTLFIAGMFSTEMTGNGIYNCALQYIALSYI